MNLDDIEDEIGRLRKKDEYKNVIKSKSEVEEKRESARKIYNELLIDVLEAYAGVNIDNKVTGDR